MKKIILGLFVCFCVIGVNAQQKGRANTETIRTSSRPVTKQENINKPMPVARQVDTSLDEKVVVERNLAAKKAKNDYSPILKMYMSDNYVNNLAETKKAKLAETYKNSYNIINVGCGTRTKDNIEIADHEHKRLQSENIQITIDKGCGTIIELKSKDELNIEFAKIK